MKILFLLEGDNRFNLASGGGQRDFFIYKALKEQGTVDIALLSNVKEDTHIVKNPEINSQVYYIPKTSKSDNKSRSYFKKFKHLFDAINNPNHYYQKIEDIEKKIDEIIKINNYDLIVVRYMGVALKTNIIKYNNLIVDIDDVPYINMNIGKKFYNSVIIDKLIRRQLKKRYTRFISEIPLALMSDPNQIQFPNQIKLINIPYSNIQSHQNTNYHPSKDSALFIGTLHYSANNLSLLYFIENVLPKVLKSKPDFQFNIIGTGLPKELQGKFDNVQGINLLGYVENIEPYFSQNSIYISPIYYGTGTNIKILEAMQNAIPIVASQQSIRGYEHFLKNDYNIVITENDEDFANKIISLLDNPSKQERLRQNAKQSLKDFGYSYDNFSNQLKLAVDTILKENKN